MTTIVTRAGKGSPLTNAELDQNFLNLNSDKLEAGDLSPYLLSATAASTYQTIAGMSSYLTTASAASTYQPLDGDLTSIAGLAGTTGILKKTAANTWALDTSTYLTTAAAASTYQTQSGMSSYLTTASASSTYQTQADMSSYLALSGGTLTGKLTAKTPDASGSYLNVGVGANSISDPSVLGTMADGDLHIRYYSATQSSQPIAYKAGGVVYFTAGTTWDNAFTAQQSFTASGIRLKGSSTGYTTFASANASATSYTLTFPAVTATLATTSDLSSYLTTATASSTYLPLAGGTLTGNLTLGGTRLLADFTSATRTMVQTTAANSATFFTLLPTGTAVNTQFQVFGSTDISNGPFGTLTINASTVQLTSAAAGTGTVLPLRVVVGGTEVLRANTTANVLIGTATDNGTDKLQVSGTIKSLTGGYVFPDGTTQTTAAAAGVTTGKAIAMALVFGG